MEKNNNLDKLNVSKRLSFFSILISSSTIICCAIPALLVSIGAGAALSSIIIYFPHLVFLSIYKIPIFTGALIMLIIAWIIEKKSEKLPCPSDPLLAENCKRLRKQTNIFLKISIFIYFIGFLFAFLLPIIY